MKKTRTIAAPGEHAVLVRALRLVRRGWTGKAGAVTASSRPVRFYDPKAARFSLLGALNRAAGDGTTSSQALSYVPGDFGPALNVQPKTKAATIRRLRVAIQNARTGTPGARPARPAGIARPLPSTEDSGAIDGRDGGGWTDVTVTCLGCRRAAPFAGTAAMRRDGWRQTKHIAPTWLCSACADAPVFADVLAPPSFWRPEDTDEWMRP